MSLNMGRCITTTKLRISPNKIISWAQARA